MKYSAVGFVLAVSPAPCAIAQIDENVEARTSRPCFGMVDPTVKDDVTNTFGCSLRASNDSTDIGAARPAAISYTADNDGDDSYAVHAALTVKNIVTALQGDPLFGALKTS